MCKGSLLVKTSVDAIAGGRYLIGKVGIDDGRFRTAGALYAVGSSVKKCVYCIKEGQKIKLDSIPADLQQKYGLNATSSATFTETVDGKDDVLDFGLGKRLNFRAFADRDIGLLVEIDLTAATPAEQQIAA